MNNRFFLFAAGISALAIFGATLATSQHAAAKNGSVNLYSYRQPFLIKPIIDQFTSQTGIQVNVVYAKRGMLERIKAEGPGGAADAVLTSDVGRLHDMVQAGVLESINSKTLNNNIPSHLRHPQGLWFGLTKRARILFVSKERVKPGEIKSYEDLADPKLKGRICIRSGKHVYNISLFASMIAHKGKAEAKKWLVGLKNNLARKPQGNDRAQAKAIFQGQCDIAIANTYYMGKMVTNKKKKSQQKWAQTIRILFPNQDTRGTHVNISGAAIIKDAKNKANAVKLIEFLSGDFAQKIYAEQNFEYPVKAGVKIHPIVKSWGAFKADKINLNKVAEQRGTASKLVDEVRLNFPGNGS